MTGTYYSKVHKCFVFNGTMTHARMFALIRAVSLAQLKKRKEAESLQASGCYPPLHVAREERLNRAWRWQRGEAAFERARSASEVRLKFTRDAANPGEATLRRRISGCDYRFGKIFTTIS